MLSEEDGTKVTRNAAKIGRAGGSADRKREEETALLVLFVFRDDTSHVGSRSGSRRLGGIRGRLAQERIWRRQQ